MNDNNLTVLTRMMVGIRGIIADTRLVRGTMSIRPIPVVISQRSFYILHTKVRSVTTPRYTLIQSPANQRTPFNSFVSGKIFFQNTPGIPVSICSNRSMGPSNSRNTEAWRLSDALKNDFCHWLHHGRFSCEEFDEVRSHCGESNEVTESFDMAVQGVVKEGALTQGVKVDRSTKDAEVKLEQHVLKILVFHQSENDLHMVTFP